MKLTIFALLASLLIYQAMMLHSALSGQLPSALTSYLYGLLIFSGPFIALLLAGFLGLAKKSLRIMATFGLLVLLLIGILLIKDDLYLGGATVLMFYGIFCAFALLGTIVAKFGEVLKRVFRTVSSKFDDTSD